MNKKSAAHSAASNAGSSGLAIGEKLKISDVPFVATFLVKKKEGMSFEAFKSHELKTHAPLALSLPGLKDYRLVIIAPAGATPQTVDAIVQVVFDSPAAYEAAMASPEGQKALADLPNMLDMSAVTVLTATSENIYAARIEGE